MNKNVFLLALVICVAGFTSAHAQVLNKNTTFKLGGLGRSVLSNDRLSGDLLQGDTITANKGLGGYTLFDLNADLTVNQMFNANTILRMKSPYGTFFGQDTYFEFRQLQFNGRIGRNLKYELGYIYIGLTKFTVHNANEPMDNKFESDVFKVRRDILNYENFYVDNQWRLQGVQLTYGLDSILTFKKIGIKAFGVRTNVTNEGLTPDRILVGGRLDLVKNDMLKFGVNGVSFTDLPVSTSEFDLKNDVFTADGAFNWQNDALLLGLSVEGGFSSTKYTDNLLRLENSFNDFFYEPEFKAGFKPAKLLFLASYRNVGPQFNSPSAQTQRINATFTPTIFPTQNQGLVDRGQMIFDRTTEEGIYNRGLSQSLQTFLPQYGNINPYGSATPNRTGISLGLMTDTSFRHLAIEAKLDMFSEINGEGTADLRKFTGIRGGFLLNVGGLAKLKRLIDVSAGIRTENTEREGGASVSFKSTIIDAGLSIETLKKVDFIGGIKMLTAKGNEFLSVRNNSISLIDGYTAYIYDGSENIYSAGFRFRFADFAQASVVYNTSQVTRNNTINTNYSFDQLFMNFILKF